MELTGRNLSNWFIGHHPNGFNGLKRNIQLVVPDNDQKPRLLQLHLGQIHLRNHKATIQNCLVLTLQN